MKGFGGAKGGIPSDGSVGAGPRCGAPCIGAMGGAFGARLPVGIGAREVDLLRRPPGRAASLTLFESSVCRSCSIWALERLGFRMRPSRLNRSQWSSIAFVRLGFFELAIFKRRASSISSWVAPALSFKPGGGLLTAVVAEEGASGMGDMSGSGVVPFPITRTTCGVEVPDALLALATALAPRRPRPREEVGVKAG